MRVVTLVLLSISLFCTFQHSRGYNILGICPSASYSHQQSFQALMKALASRGHKVTVLSTVPLKNPPPNYENVDLSFSYVSKDCTGLRHMGAYALLHQNLWGANYICRHQLFSPAINELITSNKTFDAIIIEQLWYQCYYALVKHYNFPVLIGFLSVGNLPYVMDSVGEHVVHVEQLPRFRRPSNFIACKSHPVQVTSRECEPGQTVVPQCLSLPGSHSPRLASVTNVVTARGN